MRRAPRAHTVLFLLVVGLSVAQVVWWTWYQLAEAGRMERSAASVVSPLERESILAEAGKRRRMFLAEGIALGCAILGAFALLAASLRRELRLREAQERFLSGATHDLKTPLATLRLGLQSLATGRMDPARTERYLSAMLSQVERLEHKVNDLLEAARLRSPDPSLEMGDGDLATEVREVVGEMEERFAESGIAVSCDLDSAPARFSRDGIRMAVRNLLENAAKYSDRGGAVSVSLKREAGQAVLAVRDEGLGFPPGEAANLFGRFYRSTSREAQARGGAGLGLYLVSEIASAHGGSASCESAGEGKGSTFSVRLPVASRSPLAPGERPDSIRRAHLGGRAS